MIIELSIYVIMCKKQIRK